MPVWKVMQVYYVLRIIRWVCRAIRERRERQRLVAEFWESEAGREIRAAQARVEEARWV